jgi:sugar-specific transcriptional regulator TrmB
MSYLSKPPHTNTLSNLSNTAVEIEEEDVDALVSLGLTARQARVYLALLMIGSSKAKTIAEVSLVNRQDIYLIISSLQDMGLIQRKLTAPTTFTATPIGEALETLIQRKAHELKSIRAKTKHLVEKFSQIPLHTDMFAGSPCLGVVSEGDRGKKYRYALENVLHGVEVVTTWKRFKQASILFEDQIGSVLGQGVAFRVVTEKPQPDSLPNWVTKALTKNLNFKLRTIPSPPSAVMAIFDNVEVAIAFNNTASLTSGLHLWSNSPNVVALSQVYFSSLWKQLE